MGRVAELGRRHDHAVPIRAECGRVLTAYVDHVSEVAHDVIDAVPAQKPRAKDDAHHSAARGDGADLIVVDVAPVLVPAADAVVGNDGGTRCHRARLEESGPVDVGEIDHDRSRLAATNELSAPSGE